MPTPRSLLAVALVLVWSRQIAAQSVRGHVLDGAAKPLYGAMVEIRDPAGHPVGTTLTSPSGAFDITVPGAGRYFYRVAAIGFQPRPLQAIDVAADGLALPPIRLLPMVMRLPDLVAVEHGRFCGRQRATDAIFSRVLESAQTALQIMKATVDARQVAFTVATIHTRTTYGAYANYDVADTVVQPLSRWPIESIDPDTLQTIGFGRTLEPGNESTREYYGPDERVLFSDWFLASHCFAVDKPPRKNVQPDTLHLRFTPARKSHRIDVEGDLVLDAHDLSLLAFSFTHTNLPNWMPDQSAGGYMQFARLPSGLWMTSSWDIWAPIGGISASDGRISVAGQVETYGWVVKTIRTDSIPEATSH